VKKAIFYFASIYNGQWYFWHFLVFVQFFGKEHFFGKPIDTHLGLSMNGGISMDENWG
jgi:hypothetical protein